MLMSDLVKHYRVQDGKGSFEHYLLVHCKRCTVRFLLPRDKAKRTENAGQLLLDHLKLHDAK